MYTRRGISDTVVYDEAGIVERHGVPPRPYAVLAALRGDTSDNLPGVPGVGEKTAAKLVTTYGDLDGIFAHVDEQTPEAAPEPGRARGPGAPQRRGDPARARRARSTLTLDDLALGTVGRRRGEAGLRRAGAALAVAAPGAAAGRRRRGGPAARRRGARAPDVDLGAVTAHRPADADAADRRAAAPLADGLARWRWRPVWAGDAGRSPLVGMAVAAAAAGRHRPGGRRRRTPAPTARCGSTTALLADGAVRDAPSAPWWGPGGAPVVAHGAKELMRSLLPIGRRHRRPWRSTPPWPPTCSTRRRAATASRTWSRCSSGWPSTPRWRPQAAGQLDLDGRGRGRSVSTLGGAQRRGPRACCSRPCARPWCAPGSSASTTRSSGPSCGCWPAWRWPGSASTPTSCAASPTGSGRVRPARGRDPRAGRRDVQRELDAAAARRALRPARARRRGARPRPGSPPTPPTLEKLRGQHPIVDDAAALPRGGEAALHLRRDACWPRWPPTGASTPPSTRPWPAPGGSRRTGPTSTTSRCAPRRAGACARRSSPPRAAGSSWPTTTRSSCASSPTCPHDPGLVAAFAEGRDIHRTTAARVFGVAPEDVTSAAAQPGQDGLLRPRLRHGGLRPGPAPVDRAVRGRSRSSTPTSWPSRRCGPTWTRPWSRPAPGATPRRCSAGGARCPTCTRPTATCAWRPSARP